MCRASSKTGNHFCRSQEEAQVTCGVLAQLGQCWATPLIPLQIGVYTYQGDPLSVVIFNTVMNTLVDTLQSRLDLGYTISGSSNQVNTCLLANSPASCQYLLNMVDDWLQWPEM